MGSHLLSPLEVGPIEPHAVHDDGELAGQRHQGFLAPSGLLQPEAPLEGGPSLGSREQGIGGGVKGGPDLGVSGLGDAPGN